MRSTILLSAVLTLAAISPTHAATSAEAWSPFRPFLGTWSGTRVDADRGPRIVREYGSTANNQNIEVRERVEGKSVVWGVLSFDTERAGIVLRPLSIDGIASALVLEPKESTESRLVFTNLESDPIRTRISYDRTGWDEFTERIERATSGQELTLVSETRFKRK